MTNDDENAGERDADAASLAQRQPFAEQRKGPDRHEQRADRLQQQSVDGRRVLQAVIGHRVVDGEADERDQRQQAGVPADRRPIANEMSRGKRQQDQAGAAPADERERDRRHMPGNEAAEHGIARPEQRRERQQQIWLIEQPAAAAACAMLVRDSGGGIALVCPGRHGEGAIASRSGRPLSTLHDCRGCSPNRPPPPAWRSGVPVRRYSGQQG